jgi:galactitol-specific phosphotransferase system IIB component
LSGTDTCNLGIASSTGIAVELERVLKQDTLNTAIIKESQSKLVAV